MSEQTPQPTVERKSIFPTGSIPKGRQAYIYLSVAVVIVLAVVFTGSGSPPSRATAKAAPPPKVATPSKDEIARFTRQLQVEAEQLQAAQARAAQAQAALEAQSRGLATPMPGAPPNAYMGPGQYYQQAPGAPPVPPPDPIEEDRKKREHTSLYASNIALSYREPAKREEPHRAEEQPQVPPAAAPQRATDSRPAQPSGYKLFEGTIIETALQNQLEGSFSGPVTCLVTTDVYSHDRQQLLIPKGTRILGSSEQVQDSDQRRLAVIFHRMIMPDGYSVDFAQVATGLDQIGATALRDKVNNHWMSTVLTSVALGAIAGFSMQGTGGFYTGDAEDMYRQGVSRQIGQDSRQILQKQLNRMPEITIRPGHRVKVWLARDIHLPAYDQHPRVPGV